MVTLGSEVVGDIGSSVVTLGSEVVQNVGKLILVEESFSLMANQGPICTRSRETLLLTDVKIPISSSLCL